MSEHLHPAIHPDADSLSAFLEGVLPEHERRACVAHLAECSRCREIVCVAQEPALVADEPVRFWKRWFAPIPVWSAAAVACVLVISIAVNRQYNKPAAPAPELTASRGALEVAPPSPEMLKPPPAPLPRAKARVNREPVPAVTVEPAPAAPPAPTAAAAAPVMANGPPAVALAGVTGTVTDPAGVAVPRAQINVVNGATGRVFTSTSDASGQFNVAGLAPGQYRLNILSPGFKQSSKQIDLQPQEIAKADSKLEIGAASETVTVNAEASLLDTETSNSLPVLPTNGSRLPGTTAAKDKLMLAADSAGGLSLSKNAGKSWKAVKGPWKGKVVRLATISDPAKAANKLFQLTTDSASIWLSRDGNHWYQAPAQR